MGKMMGKAIKMAVGMQAIKKIADKKKLPIQIAKKWQKKKNCPYNK
jgi:hypothetical protein